MHTITTYGDPGDLFLNLPSRSVPADEGGREGLV